MFDKRDAHRLPDGRFKMVSWAGPDVATAEKIEETICDEADIRKTSDGMAARAYRVGRERGWTTLNFDFLEAP